MEKLMIIISGKPATGKTTLSKNLADRFNLPVINKDEIKELLFDTLGIKDREWGLKLGGASFELTYFFTEKLLQSGSPFIVEGNFDNNFSRKAFQDLKAKYSCQILQIYCHTEDTVLYERYISRDESGERHQGHIKLTSSFEEYKININKKDYKLDIEGIHNIDIDTTRFEDVNFSAIYDEVEKIITR